MLNAYALSQRAEERAVIYSKLSGIVYSIIQIAVVPAVYIGGANTSIKGLIAISFLVAAFYFLLNKAVYPNVSYLDVVMVTTASIIIWVVITSIFALFYGGMSDINEHVLNQQLFLFRINKYSALGFVAFFGVLDYIQEKIRIISREPNINKRQMFERQILWNTFVYVFINLIIVAAINIIGIQTTQGVPTLNWSVFCQVSMIVYLIFILGIILRKDGLFIKGV